ncbi:uncharacterized protein C2orf81 homolog [Harpia harpyja]|uniref:uncharacterized protein C2orf81 homolog n=1 Tax=Harpia harpyja TaxID=202280 RepID=UPI0022B211C5|nr:uncharacterized protein C2orf81 homolog [Harpia harpyja]
MPCQRHSPPCPGTGHGGSPPAPPITRCRCRGPGEAETPGPCARGTLSLVPLKLRGGRIRGQERVALGPFCHCPAPGCRCPDWGSSCPPGTTRRRGSCKGCRASLQKKTPREQAATSKSRGEKSRLPTIAAALANAVPGRLPEEEWLSLLRAEQRDRDAGDILAELLGRVMDECTKADMARQTVAFTVGQARDALLQIIQWRFLARDEGETDLEGDSNWQEDEEPEPCAIDSWAQGSVPVLRVHLYPGEGEVSSVRAPGQHGRQDHATADEAGAPPAQTLCPCQVTSTSTIPPVPGPSCPELLPDEAAIAPRLPEGKPPHTRPAPLCLARPPAPCPPPSPAEPLGQPEQGRCPPRTSHGDVEGSGAAVVSSHVPPLPPPSCTSLVSIRSGRPLRSMGAKREGSGTVLGVPRRGPSSRPERWIRPQVEVLDTETKPPACPQGAGWRSRGPELGSWRLPRGLATAGRGRLQPPPLASPQLPGPMPRQLSSLLDSARLAPSVTVRRDGSVKCGLCIPAHGEEEEEETEEAKRDLRPICPTVPLPAIAARQVTGDGEC